VITYRASLDVPVATLTQVTAWLSAHRRTHDRRPEQRAASPHTQAILVLRWLKNATGLRLLARDAHVSLATAYRYLHEALDVIAAHAPDLHQVLEHAHRQGWPYLCLDGTLIPTAKVHTPNRSSDLWYSGKHKRHGGNIQVLTDPTGYPIWTSPVEPGSTHDITAARTHVLPALYPAAATGVKTLTDKGYTGAGIGIIVPFKGHQLAPDSLTRNKLINGLRAPAERANALLKTTWKALRHVTVCPWRITTITTAALVLLHLQRGTR
jgi:DDE superfamily endonuclease